MANSPAKKGVKSGEITYEAKVVDPYQEEINRLRGSFAEYVARDYYVRKGFALMQIIYPVGQNDSAINPLDNGKDKLSRVPEHILNPTLERAIGWNLIGKIDGHEEREAEAKRIISLLCPESKLPGSETTYYDTTGLPDYIHASRENGIFFVEVKSNSGRINDYQKKTFKRILKDGFKVWLFRIQFAKDCTRCGKRHFQITGAPEITLVTEKDLL